MGYMRIYGLDVKDRVRGEGPPKITRVRTHISMARIYGADLRNRIVSATLTYDKTTNANQLRLAFIHLYMLQIT